MKDIEIFVPSQCKSDYANGNSNGTTTIDKFLLDIKHKDDGPSVEIDSFIKKDNGDDNLEYEVEIPSQSGLRRFLNDTKFRHRFFHTACVFWSMLAMGWRIGLTGPTFPDLRQIINEDLSKSSWIFTSISLGGLIGSVISGLAYDRFNKLIVFGVIDFGLAASAAVTPWCSNFPLMFTAHLLHGMFVSALDTAATSDVIHVWSHEGGPYMQAVHFGFSVGAIISPFLAEPFLAKKESVLPHTTAANMFQNDSLRFDASKLSALPLTMMTSSDNVTMASAAVGPAAADAIIAVSNTIHNGSTTNQSSYGVHDLQYVFEYGETNIHIPYFISTIVSLSAMLSFTCLYCCVGSVYKNSRVTSKQKTSPKKANTVKQYLGRKFKIFFTILLAGLLLVSVMDERHFRDFLMTFAILQLGWSKTKGSNVTATFWIAFAVGRLSGIFTVKMMRQTFVLLTYVCILTVGTFCLWMAVLYDVHLLVFVSTACVGVGMSALFASCFSWLSENILTVTGKMTSAMFIVFSSGAMIFPILAGYLMKNYDLRWFVYLQLILVVLMNVIWLSVIVVYTCVSRKQQTMIIEDKM